MVTAEQQARAAGFDWAPFWKFPKDPARQDWTRRVCSSCGMIHAAEIARCPMCGDCQFGPATLPEATESTEVAPLQMTMFGERPKRR
jgi:uncharacterized OB-fold protein